ncbi:MAG: glycosyltransferase family 4 protein [candidate division Zixibacteria bacterium]|nr:glycosyltransferase family 4 protein [candidate division Zixibacteria bacterium]MDH3937606.1 glycosyltransferase family 4 protein [candidate division Zixibacteria bacterium]MDH4032317.1 glycosyltransferase family 4 protein [candidate division Zixibacteria bacterium]
MNEPSTSRDYSIGLLCSSGSWGGLEMNVLRLGIWLKQRGWQVVLYGQRDTKLFDEAERDGLSVRHLHSTFKYGDLINASRLARYVKKDNVQRLIINYGKDLFLAVLAKKFARGFFKLLMQQHMHVGGHKKDAFHTWEYNHLDAWIAPLPMFKDRLVQYTRLETDKIHVIPFGIELDRLTSNRPDRAAARQGLGLPADAYIAGIVGRLESKKGQDVLIKACRGVHDAGGRLHLLIVGDKTINDPEGYPQYLDSLTEQLDLKSFVHFHPHQSDVVSVYAAMDLFVMASHSETYGMVTIEAMASGLPVIGTAEGGTVQIINDGVNGLLVPPQDEESLASALLSLMNNPTHARSLASRAALEAVEKYSHHRQVLLIETLFDELGGRG